MSDAIPYLLKRIQESHPEIDTLKYKNPKEWSVNDETNRASIQAIIDGFDFNDPMNAIEKDQIKYGCRASSRDKIISLIAANNVERVRTGVWTTQDLIDLTNSAEVITILNNLNSLSFEIALQNIENATHPLATQAIKDEYSAIITEHLYNA